MTYEERKCQIFFIMFIRGACRIVFLQWACLILQIHIKGYRAGFGVESRDLIFFIEDTAYVPLPYVHTLYYPNIVRDDSGLMLGHQHWPHTIGSIRWHFGRTREHSKNVQNLPQPRLFATDGQKVPWITPGVQNGQGLPASDLS